MRASGEGRGGAGAPPPGSGGPIESTSRESSERPAAVETRVDGVMLYELPSVEDGRGELTFAQVGAQLPFVVQRYFTISRMPEGAVRGRHAHRELHEFVVCLQGACTFAVDDGKTRQEVRLERHTVGLHLPPHVWREYFDFTPDALVLVLASDIYRESDYVHELRELPQERADDE